MAASMPISRSSCKLLNDRNGTVRSQKVFTAKVPVGGSDNRAYVAALDAAFAQVTREIVAWTSKIL